MGGVRAWSAHARICRAQCPLLQATCGRISMAFVPWKILRRPPSFWMACAGYPDAGGDIAEVPAGYDGHADLRRSSERGEMALRALHKGGFRGVRHVRGQRAVIVGH